MASERPTYVNPEANARPGGPSRAVVPTGALHYGFKVEVEAVAVV